jgi:hypothetical protein
VSASLDGADGGPLLLLPFDAEVTYSLLRRLQRLAVLPAVVAPMLSFPEVIVIIIVSTSTVTCINITDTLFHIDFNLLIFTLLYFILSALWLYLFRNRNMAPSASIFLDCACKRYAYLQLTLWFYIVYIFFNYTYVYIYYYHKCTYI